MANALLYGFQTFSEDLLNRRAVDFPEVQAAIDLSLAAHNAGINAFVDVFAERTTEYQGRFRQNASGVLEPMDEFGRPTPKKFSDYTVAWPIQMGGGATGFTWLSQPKMTVQELNDGLSQLFIADLRWMRIKMLGALVDNTSAGVTFTDEVYGAITCYGLANGDASPLYYKQLSDAMATDTHYFADANAIADAHNPFGTIRDELLEHPENSGDVISLIPTSLKATTVALTEFVEVTDPNITPGDDTARVSGFPAMRPPDSRPLGYCGSSGVFVAEWPVLPADYIVTYCTSGRRPLKFRQDPLPQFQGFFPKDRMDSFPFVGDIWIRRGGFAASNRAGAAVSYINTGNSSTYAIPTGYGILKAP